MENIDIKALARELKRTAANEQALPIAAPKSRGEDSNQAGKSGKAARSETVKSMITSANQRKDFVLRADIRIDEQVHDILKQLKGRTDIVIGALASVLLEDFILEHKREIIRLIKPKPNRLIQ